MSVYDMFLAVSDRFSEFSPLEFYQFIFPSEDLEERGRIRADGDEYKYNPILIEEVPTQWTNSKGNQVFRYYRRHVFSDYQEIKDALNSENFITLNPVSYVGKERISKNARYLYAIAVDLDGVETEHHIGDLFHQMVVAKFLPLATFIVLSGNGFHLYYVLERPVKCYPETIKQMNRLKNALTRKIWNNYTTIFYKNNDVQKQPVLQPFRMVGSVTKDYKSTGHRVRAFKIGEKVTIDYLNSFIPPEDRADVGLSYKTLSLDIAKEKYPQWFEKRIIKGLPKGQWVCKRDLYLWWLNQIRLKATEGHRYYDILLLCAYALKCGISFDELSEDAYDLVPLFDELTKTEENHFTTADVAKALQAYKKPETAYMSIDAIEHYSAIRIEKNKRNGRKQADHLKLARYVRDEINGHKENWRTGNGRPSRKDHVVLWRKDHPSGKKADCIKETGLSKPTVYKYWEV